MTESVSISISTVTGFEQLQSSTDHNTPECPTAASVTVLTDTQSPPSPSIGLPSPPDSPSSQSDSVSSFPSVSSSFFFSSNAASPPHGATLSDYSRDTTKGLIIPHLALPPAMRRASQYGKMLGEMRLLVLGDSKGITPGLLFDDNEDVVDIASKWEDREMARVVTASTDWIEHRDAHGFEKYEPCRNIEIIDVPSFDRNGDPSEIIATLKATITAPFMQLSQVLTLKPGRTAMLSKLLTSPNTPLHTALLFHVHSPPSTAEMKIFESLGSLIPIVPIVQQRRYIDIASSSSFQPHSTLSLRSGLFHSPEILLKLRAEAAQRFIQWLEVESVVQTVRATKSRSTRLMVVAPEWSKTRWESDLDISLSQVVSQRLREEEVPDDGDNALDSEKHVDGRPALLFPTSGASFDPLHIPSLLMFSISLIGPMKTRISGIFHSVVEKVSFLSSAQVAFIGGLAAGFGIALFMTR